MVQTKTAKKWRISGDWISQQTIGFTTNQHFENLQFLEIDMVLLYRSCAKALLLEPLLAELEFAVQSSGISQPLYSRCEARAVKFFFSSLLLCQRRCLSYLGDSRKLGTLKFQKLNKFMGFPIRFLPYPFLFSVNKRCAEWMGSQGPPFSSRPAGSPKPSFEVLQSAAPLGSCFEVANTISTTQRYPLVN